MSDLAGYKDNIVVLSREEAEDLLRRAKGAENLHLHLEEKELELRKEKERNKRFKAQLVDTYYSKISDLTLHQTESSPQDAFVTDNSRTARTLSSNDKISYSPQSLASTSLERDGAPPSLITPRMSPSSSSNICHHDDGLSRIKTGQTSPRVFKFTSDESISSQKVTAQTSVSEIIEENKENIKPHLTMEEGGVSEAVYNNLKQELLRVKKQLSQLLQEKKTNLKEVETEKNFKMRINDLKDQVHKLQGEKNSLNRDLIMYKELVKRDKEGVTVHNSSQENSLSSTGTLSGGSLMSQSGSITEKSKDEENRPAKQQQKVKENSAPETENKSDVQQVMKEMQSKIFKLEAQLRDAIIARDKCKADFRNIQQTYQQLLNVDKQGDEEKLEKLRRDLECANEQLQNEKVVNEELLSNIELMQNNISKEKDNNIKLEAKLREEQRCHGVTKHNMHVMYSNLKDKFEKLSQENRRLQQHIATTSRETTVSGSSSSSGRLSSANSAYTPLFHRSDPSPIASNFNEASQSTDTFGRLPEESSDMLLQPSNSQDSVASVECYVCERCYAEFTDERKHLEHINKCFVD